MNLNSWSDYRTTTSLIVFACVFGGALLGMFLRRTFPKQHLSGDARSTVNLGIGLIGTMSGIALGLLVASAASKYDTQKNELTKLWMHGRFSWSSTGFTRSLLIVVPACARECPA
jgi:hypothetical protein